MSRHFLQAFFAVLVWTLVPVYAGVPFVLAVLIPIDVALVLLAVLHWRSVQA